MSDVSLLKLCYFCENWFPPEQVKEQRLQRHPTSSYEDVFACDDCLKKSRVEKLTSEAVKALEQFGFNEVELTEGNVKVHLIRFTPTPTYTTPWIYPGWSFKQP